MCILGTLDLVPKMQCMWLLHPAVEHHPLLYCTSVSCHNHNKEERFIIIYQLDILKKQIFIKIPFSEVTWLLPIGQKLVVTNRDTTVFVSWQLLCYTRPARVFAIKKHRHVTTSTKYTQIMGTITIMTKYCPLYYGLTEQLVRWQLYTIQYTQEVYVHVLDDFLAT